MNDELEREDLEAWDVEPLGADFEDRVMTALGASAPTRPSAAPGYARARTPWIAALSFAAAAALAVAVALWPRAHGPAADAITILASEPAQLDYSPGSHHAEQRSGTVTYRVRPGTAFCVHTPAADITVHGTDFTVEMLNMNDQRRRKYLGAGALALGGAAVAVYVTAGQVEVHNEHGRATLAPGQMAVASEYAGPRSEPTPTSTPKQAKRGSSTRAMLSPGERTEIERRLADALDKRRTAAGSEPDVDTNDTPRAEEPMGSLDEGYIRDVVREDLLPIVEECYENALEQQPDLAGTVTLHFSIAGDESVGGIVDDVSFGEGTSFIDDGETPPPVGTPRETMSSGAKARPKLPIADNPEFAECLSESTASLLFDPPQGGGRVEVSYPFIFTQDDDAPAKP